jgi:hypothetical protein
MLRRQTLWLAIKVVPGAGPSGSTSWGTKPSDFSQRQNTVLDSHGDVDLSALPSTIPGVSREELAERLRKMESMQRQQTMSAHRDSIAKQIDTMRRAMPPKQFKEFLRGLEEKEAKSMDEAEKVSHMTPTELYRYQLKKQRNQNILQWINLLALCAAFVLGIYFLFYFLIFHFY